MMTGDKWYEEEEKRGEETDHEEKNARKKETETYVSIYKYEYQCDRHMSC